jgi:hydroxymethylbilane synthase
MGKIRIGTRESQLAVWQATQVKELLANHGTESELIFIKSDGDVDLVTPLYDIGVQGIFTRSLDAALLSNKIDIAVHSMKDVPVQLAKGLRQAAVLKRGSYKDIFVPHPDISDASKISGDKKSAESEYAIVATSSIRRIAQWLNKYPNDKIENLRGNVNTRLKKLKESNWHGAVFAAAGLERIGLRPENAIDLDWMLPAPAQGAIMIVCRGNDEKTFESCHLLNHERTALCTKIERDFLAALMGGCSTPISALAEIRNGEVHFEGNILSPDGRQKSECNVTDSLENASDIGFRAAKIIFEKGGQMILDKMKNAAK